MQLLMQRVDMTNISAETLADSPSRKGAISPVGNPVDVAVVLLSSYGLGRARGGRREMGRKIIEA